MDSKIWLSSPHMGGREIGYISEAFGENQISPFGSNIDRFERDLEEYFEGGVYASAVSSGTAALHLALEILKVRRGDEVICQSMTYYASASPILYLRARPIFVDSEPDTWNMCPDALEEAIRERSLKGKKPRAIVLVHSYGMPAKVDDIMFISKKYNIPVVEDSAAALGSSYKGKKCGTFGEISVLSFNGNKIITTSAGGALLSKNKMYKSRALFLAEQAKDDGSVYYRHSTLGYNYRMSNICAGIGIGQMEMLPERVVARRKVHLFYKDLFGNIPGISILKEVSDDYFSNHWLSAIVVDATKTGFTSEDLRLKLSENNIESRPLWKPMHLQPVFKKTLYYGGNFSENLFNSGLCLPSGSNLSQEQLERIRHTVLSLFR